MSERQRKVIPDLETDFAQGREAVLEFVATISPPRLEPVMKYTEARGLTGACTPGSVTSRRLGTSSRSLPGQLRS